MLDLKNKNSKLSFPPLFSRPMEFSPVRVGSDSDELLEDIERGEVWDLYEQPDAESFQGYLDAALADTAVSDVLD